MLDEKTLTELRSKLPVRYVKPIQEAYNQTNGREVSRFTVMRFMNGETYNEMLHAAVLTVVEKQQELTVKTQAALAS